MKIRMSNYIIDWAIDRCKLRGFANFCGGQPTAKSNQIQLAEYPIAVLSVPRAW